MKYFLIAGEASGDLHSSNLMRELKKSDPAAEFCFLGGDLMQAQGGTMIRHYRQMAFMGVTSVLLNAGTVLGNLKACKKAILTFQPDVLILVDYPSFNLRVAKWLKTIRPDSKIYYYISPKIWAWKEWRITQIKKYIDKMYTILPFETAFYAKHNYAVEYVGNPSVDSVSMREGKDKSFEQFCAENHLPVKPIIAILAGSRKQEIKRCLARMVEAGLRLLNYQVVVACAPGIDRELYSSILGESPALFVEGKTYELLQAASAAVVNSGTATLETALVGTPQVVVYHIPCGRFGNMVKEKIIKVKFVSLVNIIAQKEVVIELLSPYFTADYVTDELVTLLYNRTFRETILSEYELIRRSLGEPGAAKRAAESMVASLRQLKS